MLNLLGVGAEVGGSCSVSRARGSPADRGALVQTHDDHNVSNASPEDLLVIRDCHRHPQSVIPDPCLTRGVNDADMRPDSKMV